VTPVRTLDGIRWVESECSHGKSFYKTCAECEDLNHGARMLLAPADDQTPRVGEGRGAVATKRPLVIVEQ
jgi:hypothetical protein